MQDVPLSVAAYDQELIERYDISDLSDVAARTPNFTFSNNLGLFGGVPVIRGIGAPRTGGASSVGVFIDGIDTGNTTGLNLQSFDVERIEVVRGPQSTQFGRGVLAGAINYVSRRPNLNKLELEALGELAEGGVYRAQGRVSVPLAEGIAFSLAAQLRGMDGFYRNKPTGRYVGDSESKSVVGGLRATFGSADQGEIYLRLAYSKEQLGQPAWHQVATNTQTGPAANQRWYVGTLRGNPALVAHNAGNYDGIDLEFYRAGLHLNYDFGGVSLASISSFNKADQLADTDIDFTGGPAFVANNTIYGDFRSTLESDIKDFSQELRLQSDPANRFTWMIGGYYRKENYEQRDFSPLPSQGGNSNRAPTAGVVERDTRTIGLFGSLGYKLTDALTLTGELRYSEDRIEERVTPRASAILNFNSSFKNVLPRVIAELNLGDGKMVYASAAKGNKPGGFNNSPGAANVPADLKFYDEEEAWSYELGTKTSWFGGKMTFNAALFYVDWSNIQVNSQIVVNGIPQGLTVNAGRANGFGGEAELRFAPNRNFELYGGIGYSPIRLIDYVDSRVRNAGITTDGRDQIAGTPDWTGNIGSIVSVPIGPAETLFLQGDVTYRSTTYATEANLAETGSRTRLDLQAGVNTGNLRLAFYVNNVLDDRSIDSARAYVNPNNYARSFIVQLTNPRQFGMRLSARY